MGISKKIVALATLAGVVALAPSSTIADDTAPAKAAEPTASSPQAKAPEASSTPLQGWDAAALKLADELAAKLQAAGVVCTNYGPDDMSLYAFSYGKRLPLPAAITSCETDGGEDVSFEVFTDIAKAREFVSTKQALLCRKAKSMKIANFPGFAYIEGDRWIIEPDELDTAERLAPIVGGTAKVAGCENQ